MRTGPQGSFGTHLRALREAAGFTQEELATIAGLSVHAVSALERGERRRPHVDTVRALSAALDLTGPARDALFGSARAAVHDAAADELSRAGLPLPLTPLLGRDDDVQTLRSWLDDRAIRLITLVGPGGVGKTRLALEVARIVAEEPATRVVFLGLAAVQDHAFVAPAIAEALGLSDVTAVDLPRRVHAACSDHPTLLVLDNCEHVLEAVPLASELLMTAGSLRILATSRAPLRIRGEREYAVGPLAVELDVAAHSPADVARAPAVRLFVERARDVRPDFRLTSKNGPAVKAICHRLDALPLALELAAPWIKVLTPEDLLERLEHDVLLSAAGPRDLPARQQTMNATVAWSYQLLDANDQRAFRRLGVLPGRFSIEAAAQVLTGGDRLVSSDQALDVVASLLNKSLVLRAESAVTSRPLYRMLETVRAYATLQLVEAGERDETMEGLARYSVAEARIALEGLFGPTQADWLDRVRGDLESHRAAMTWLMERGRAEEACDIAYGLVLFWLIRGHAAEGMRWYDQTLKLPKLTPMVEAKALVGASLMLYAQGDLERARQAADRAFELAHRLGDTMLAGHAQTMAGHVAHACGNLAEARDHFRLAAEGFRAIAFEWAAGSALSGQGGVALASGDIREAERLFDEATAAFQGAGPWFLAPVRCFRAVLAVHRGKADDTIALMRESLVQIRALHDKYAFVYALVPLAAAAMLKGDAAWAARILGARAAVSERTGAKVVVQVVQDIGERAEQEARTQLGAEKFAKAFSAGRAASIDGLLHDIDAHSGWPRSSSNEPRE
jgi:predicted ATPase/DNA-binding XRE family transcriptional regulator